MTVYRRRVDSDTWHWCRNCSNWPISSYVEQEKPGKTRPITGELDNECRTKERDDNCR